MPLNVSFIHYIHLIIIFVSIILKFLLLGLNNYKNKVNMSIVIGVIICLAGYRAMVSFNETPEYDRTLFGSWLPIILYAIGIYLIIQGF